MLVRQRTAQTLSFENLFTRNHGSRMHVSTIKKLSEEDVENLFQQEHVILSGKATIATINFLRSRIIQLEKAVLKVAKLKDEYKKGSSHKCMQKFGFWKVRQTKVEI